MKNIDVTICKKGERCYATARLLGNEFELLTKAVNNANLNRKIEISPTNKGNTTLYFLSKGAYDDFWEIDDIEKQFKAHIVKNEN